MTSIISDAEGNLWFGTSGGVSKYDGKEFVSFTTTDGLAGNMVLDILQAKSGDLWFALRAGGVSRYRHGKFQTFTAEDGLTDDRVHCVTEDREGTLWFGTSHGGVSRYDDSVVNIPLELSGRMFMDAAENLWCNLQRGGLGRYDGAYLQTFASEDGLPANYAGIIYQDSQENIWVGTSNGIARYDGEKFASFREMENHSVQGIHENRAGLLYIGSLTGLYSYYDGQFTQLASMQRLGGWVTYMVGDQNDNLWFSTDRNGVYRYDGNTFTHFTIANGLPHHSSWHLLTDRTGNIWIATIGGGLCRYDGETFRTFTADDGLSGNNIGRLFEDSRGDLWISVGSGGISKFDGQNFQIFTTEDGLQSHTAVGISEDEAGNIIFGTGHGYTIYTPPKEQIPPLIAVTKVVADKAYENPKELTTSSTIPLVSFSYYGISFKTHRMRYNYMLQGYDTDWIATWDETVSYENLKPGNYTFKVVAINRDLVYSEPASVKLEVIPDPRNHRIAQLEGELAERERTELERMHQELEDARQIQLSLLPKEPPEIEGYEIAGISVPAREVSGDFYTYLSLGKNTGIVLADVTGKSVKAAMVAALASGTLNAEIEGREDIWDSPAGILSRLNTRLQPHLIRGMYVAMSLGIITPDKQRLTVSNAGMPYPVVKRGKEVWELEVNGMPLGLMTGAEYTDLSVSLEAGDIVVFCSDGVIEATNEDEEMYQTERLLELIQNADPALSPQKMVDLVVKDVTEFSGDVELSDDITIVVIRCKE